MVAQRAELAQYSCAIQSEDAYLNHSRAPRSRAARGPRPTIVLDHEQIIVVDLNHSRGRLARQLTSGKAKILGAALADGLVSLLVRLGE